MEQGIFTMKEQGSSTGEGLKFQPLWKWFGGIETEASGEETKEQAKTTTRNVFQRKKDAKCTISEKIGKTGLGGTGGKKKKSKISTVTKCKDCNF